MIFIDSGAFLARYLKHDQHHTKAIAFWDDLTRDNVPCLTSNFVLNEVLTLLGQRATHEFAAETARQLYSSNVLQILRPDVKDEIAAIAIIEKYADQRVSFCDCVSFALMRRHGISDAFTFDGHFSIAKFNIRP